MNGFSISKLQEQMAEISERPEKFKVPKIHNSFLTNMEANYASEFHERLGKYIEEFDASLDPSLEVGIRLVSFGQTVVFHIESMGYWNPSLISFRGHAEDGSPVNLIQHTSQISILLMTLPRKDPSKPKIGFRLPEKSEEEKS